MKKFNSRIVIICCLVLMMFCMSACAKEKKNDSVGRVRLNIETYLAGKDQATHPAVISFEKPWNGYRYWMAYTPYPYGNGEEENPSVAVSNDLYKWETPIKMVNPIANNEETGCDELKDVHILYREDLNRIEVWYLGRVSEQLGGDGTSLTLFRKYTEDGITWSDYEVMTEVQYLSPTILWNDNKYQMWGIGFGTYGTEGTIVYQESTDGITWTTPVQCSIDGEKENLAIWHGAVTHTEGEYKFVYVESANESQTIEFCESVDGIEFTGKKSIIQNDNKSLWRNFYRPSLLNDNGQNYLFYGVVSDANEWYISMSSGESIEHLIGINEKDSTKMIQLDSGVTDTNSLYYKVHKIYEYVRNSIRFELLFLIPIMYRLFSVMKNRRKTSYIICLLGSMVICMLYTFLRIQPRIPLSILAVVFTSVGEGIVVYCISHTIKYRKE